MKRAIVATVIFSGIALLTAPCVATEKQARTNALAALLGQTILGYNTKGGTSAVLMPGEILKTEVELRAGIDYIFIAAGCNDAYDVDIIVSSTSGIVLGYDNDYDDIAVTGFVAPYTGKYTLQAILSRSKNNGAHVFIVVGFK